MIRDVMRGWGSHLWIRVVRIGRRALHWGVEVRDDELGHGFRTRCGLFLPRALAYAEGSAGSAVYPECWRRVVERSRPCRRCA